MVHCSSLRSVCALAVLALVAGCGGGGGGAAAPHVTSIPARSITGGVFSLDVSTYVTVHEGGTATYAVLSGGGSFTGSTYSNTFATMGSYPVSFRVTDDQGKHNDGAFTVTVTAATFLVVREDNSGLAMVDAVTENFVTVAGSAATPAFAAGLPDGRLVYQLGSSSNLRLWLFDPMTRLATQIASNKTYVTYRTQTSDGKVVFTTGPASDTDLWIYNPRTGLTTEIAAQPGEVDGNAMVSAVDLVFYERGQGGQADVYYFDPSTGESTVVANGATAEHLQAVLPNGAAVFSRLGSSGETDLFYFTVAGGEAEVGASFTTQSKTYCGGTSNGRVVYTATDGATTDLGFWSPANGQNTTIHTAITAFHALGSGNEVVYQNGAAVTFYDLDDATTAVLGAAHNYVALTTGVAIVESNSTPGNLVAATMVASPATTSLSAGGAVQLAAVLGNGDVVLARADGSSLRIWDLSALAWRTIAGTSLTYAGPGVDAGDFVYGQTASSQTDLMMWDDSAVQSVTISNTTGDDTWQATSHGKVFFTRLDSTTNKADLFVYDVAGAAETQLTTTDGAGQDHDHTVLGTYSGTR